MLCDNVFFLPTSFSYKEAHSVWLARPAGVGVQPMIAGLPHQNAPHIKLLSPARPLRYRQAIGHSPLYSRRDEPRTHFKAPRCGVLTPTDAAAAARRLPPPPLPVRCLSPPKPSLALSSHTVHFFLPSTRFSPYRLRRLDSSPFNGHPQ